MASFYGYIILIVGLSVVLAAAGIDTGMSHLIGSMTPITPQSPTSNFAVDTTPFQLNGVAGSPWMIALYGILVAFAISGGIRVILGGTFGIAETVKVTITIAILALMISDFRSLFIYIQGMPDWSGVTRAIAIIVYLPLTAGMIFSAIDWIGGGK